jgi:hypothetical protein
VAANNLGSRIRDVGKHTRGSTENIVLELYSCVDRNVVLDFDIVPNDDISGDKNVLPQNAMFSKSDIWRNMTKMPDSRTFTDIDWRVDPTGLMNVITHWDSRL